MPKGLDHKAWLNFLGFPPKTRPWEEAPFFGVPADDNQTAWIIPGFLSGKEVDHILTSGTLYFAVFDNPATGPTTGFIDFRRTEKPFRDEGFQSMPSPADQAACSIGRCPKRRQ